MFLTKILLAQESPPAADTLQGPDFIITPRFNTAGHFPFSGSLINKHPNVDLNIFFEHRNYGFFLFKSHDLEEPHSILNYFQPGIFKKIPITPKVKVGVVVGYLFSQTTGFRDGDSDYYTAAIGYWTINEKVRLENTTLFYDLTHVAKLADRLLITWTAGKRRGFRFDLYVWHRVVLEQGVHATSASVALNFPAIRLADGVSIVNTLSYQGYLTRNKPDYARRDGFLFSVALPIVVRKPG